MESSMLPKKAMHVCIDYQMCRIYLRGPLAVLCNKPSISSSFESWSVSRVCRDWPTKSLTQRFSGCIMRRLLFAPMCPIEEVGLRLGLLCLPLRFETDKVVLKDSVLAWPENWTGDPGSKGPKCYPLSLASPPHHQRTWGLSWSWDLCKELIVATEALQDPGRLSNAVARGTENHSLLL